MAKIVGMRKTKKKPEERMQAGFRLEIDEEEAFLRYQKSERFPLTLADLTHRLFREFLIDSGYISPQESDGASE